MTQLNIMAPSRGKSYEPGPFLGALPLPFTAASADHWRMATRTLVNSAPSAYPQRTQRPLPHDIPLTERLFDALAAFKMKTATLAAAHFSRDERARLFKHLDSLLDAESWDSADEVSTEASFTTLLRMTLFLGGRRPALGITGTGNFIATWTEGADRLTIECRPEDQVRWVLVQNLDGQRESAAGQTMVRRLPEVLRPYDAPKRWFPNAFDQAPA
jgi:hypothetical protein